MADVNEIRVPKIAATIGQATCGSEMLRELSQAGVRLFRYNLAAQLGLDEHGRRMKLFREVQAERGGDIELMLDLPFPGAKFRIGMLPEPRHLIEKGTRLTFATGVETNSIERVVPVDVARLGERVEKDQVVTVGDGELALRVREVIDHDSFVAEALTTHYLPCQKSLNVGSVDLSATDRNDALAAFVASVRPEYVAFSFVENLQSARDAFALLERHGLGKGDYKAIAKIETLAGINALPKFIREFHSVMVARGDLALNLDFAYLGEAQEHIIDSCRAFERACIVSTQLCESVATISVPNRSELVGMHHVATRGVEYMLLAKETSTLAEPVRAVHTLQRVIDAVRNPMFASSRARAEG
ncbi:pyruvate kinase [Burkholderia sp. JSH-S8]|uniref:pyruvate kinase n=1 Tax=Burkholderia stagnalis TaxID=1503054 RepID=UPI000F811A04|nr:pyruvate kinase [Burkholderia stagnalis]WGS44615.1 pyruvate kinase [Burkholderia sp. JSH-S8]